jgi:hypothetical protein
MPARARERCGRNPHERAHLVRATTGDDLQGLVSADRWVSWSYSRNERLPKRRSTTGGAAGWQDPPEIRLEKVTSDGFLVTRRPHLLAQLPAPWPEAEAQPHSEVMIELKLAGNHLDREAVERALLRRQARQLQRVKDQDASWRGEEPLWLIAPHLPPWLDEMRTPVRLAPGCYWIEPQWQRFLWIAANELPLVDELIPFLLARSGQALDEFCRWVAPRRPLDWVLNMVESTSRCRC